MVLYGITHHIYIDESRQDRLYALGLFERPADRRGMQVSPVFCRFPLPGTKRRGLMLHSFVSRMPCAAVITIYLNCFGKTMHSNRCKTEVLIYEAMYSSACSLIIRQTSEEKAENRCSGFRCHT